jgi:hypothetical protein
LGHIVGRSVSTSNCVKGVGIDPQRLIDSPGVQFSGKLGFEFLDDVVAARASAVDLVQ